MCGIIAYVGGMQCEGVLMEGLRRLEYRGYDSAGLAVHAGETIKVMRAVGKLAQLEDALRYQPLSGTVGIGHTRWATHGRPSENNAHPHVAGKIVLVHNGILENHAALRKQLEKDGVRFASDTDTEVLAHLVDVECRRGVKTLAEAVRLALQGVRGAYAIAVMSMDMPGEIVIAKYHSPLVIGVGEQEMLAASDIVALLHSTRKIILLEDGEMALLQAAGVLLFKQDGSSFERAPKLISWSAAQAEKEGHKHFMLKEIHEQPRAFEDTLRGRINLREREIVAEEIGVSLSVADQIQRIYLIACGTSYYAALIGRYWIEQLARIPATVEIASEMRYRQPVFLGSDLVVAISQSGETLDTLAALQGVKAQVAYTLAIVNGVDSAIARMAHGSFYTHAGPEIGVASTKCFTTQLAALLLLAIEFGLRRGTLSLVAAHRLFEGLWRIPGKMRGVLHKSESIREIAGRHLTAKNMLFLGRGINYPIALEGALKLKELSYVHAEGYAAGEMKHGPIALIDEHMPVIAICPRDAHYEKMLSNMKEVQARGGQLIMVGTEGDEEMELFTALLSERASARRLDWIQIPSEEPELLPFLTALPLQLFAYHFADLKGTDIDQPRNLAKTVTVE
ncbi:glutamine--fructose-6-phosphate transaminase (isomerizing) [Pajaroellobacter abortibovis]|uniref:Glutamine--fructose-6-phosphate aminotransferase [isomerizing] n=1 Tax=Pajaroellobacter abortibovis TaxID=1882918 RepID=A0A1L6MYH0_9BACT|nr:glutamine--fructose-6-phosphate transaminase (isomerizing) [Pajaroellobacter abortibovis]APS00621.1 glutamine--fructose-6-phosphate aminotransferase [Pajaroellobacter abortibovis]